MKKPIKIIRIAILAACLFYIIRFFAINKEDLKILFKLNLSSFICLLGLSLFYQIIHGYRFKIILEKCSSKRLPIFPWLRIFVLGRFLNMVFPQAGNAYRGICLKKDYDISYTRYISGFTSFAWMDMSINLIIATAIVLVLNPDLKIGQFHAWTILLGTSLFTVITPVLAGTFFHRINLKNQYLSWVHSKLSEVLEVTLNNLKDTAYLSKIITLGMVVLVRTILVYYILFLSFDIKLGVSALAIFYSLFKLATFVNITPGNLGLQEVAYGFLSEQMGIGMAQGILVAVVARVLSTIVIVTLGLLLGGFDLLRHRKDYSKFVE